MPLTVNLKTLATHIHPSARACPHAQPICTTSLNINPKEATWIWRGSNYLQHPQLAARPHFYPPCPCLLAHPLFICHFFSCFSFHSFYSRVFIFIHLSFLIISLHFSMFCYFFVSSSIFHDFCHFAFVHVFGFFSPILVYSFFLFHVFSDFFTMSKKHVSCNFQISKCFLSICSCCFSIFHVWHLNFCCPFFMFSIFCFIFHFRVFFQLFFHVFSFCFWCFCPFHFLFIFQVYLQNFMFFPSVF